VSDSPPYPVDPADRFMNKVEVLPVKNVRVEALGTNTLTLLPELVIDE
jgi:hypothetical protein